MKAIQIFTDSDFKRNRNLINQARSQYVGKAGLLLTIAPIKKKRSNPQNRYYFGCLLPIAQQAILAEWGEVWSIEMCHEFFKARFLFHEKINENTGEIVKIPKSTTENSTTDQEWYHTEIRTFLHEWFNVTAPLPNEEITMFQD